VTPKEHQGLIPEDRCSLSQKSYTP